MRSEALGVLTLYIVMNKCMDRIVYALLAILLLASRAVGQDLQAYRVISINIRYDNPNDKPHDWTSRRDSLGLVLLREQAALIGMQEVLHQQAEELKVRLQGYRMIGVGRLDGKAEGEYAPIWYRAKRFRLVRSGHFWLSETPNVAGRRGWDAACERIATWAVLRDRHTKRELFVLNTHLDHEGQQARRASVALLRDSIVHLSEGRPVMVMGDFNATPTDAVLNAFLEPNASLMLLDSYVEEAGDVEQGATFHNFGRLARGQRPRIDYILYNKGLERMAYRRLRTDGPELCLSDHHGVVVLFRLVRP